MTKVRIGNVKRIDSYSEYTNGVGETKVVIEFEVNKGVIEWLPPESKEVPKSLDNPMEIAKKLQRYCKERHCGDCLFNTPTEENCPFATEYNPTQWNLGDGK